MSYHTIAMAHEWMRVEIAWGLEAKAIPPIQNDRRLGLGLLAGSTDRRVELPGGIGILTGNKAILGYVFH